MAAVVAAVSSSTPGRRPFRRQNHAARPSHRDRQRAARSTSGKQAGRVVALGGEPHQPLGAPLLDGVHLGGDRHSVAHHVVQELLQVVDEEVLVGKKTLRGELVLPT